MPTVFRDGPYRVYFFSNEDDEPPHVHVDRDAATAKFWLDPLQVARNRGFPDSELTRIRRMLEPRQVELMEAWYGWFGI
jgi:hypothetical protein